MVTLAVDLFRSRRTLVISVCLGLLLVSIGYLALYPSFDDQLETFAADLPDAYKALIGDADIASAEGYIRSQVFSLLAPLLISGASIAAGSSLARAERDKTLAVLAVMPLHRGRLAGAWWLFVGMVAGIGMVVTAVGVIIGSPLAGANVGVDRIVLATLPMGLFALLVGSIALLASTISGAPTVATGAGWFAVVVAFLANSLGELVDSLDWLATISPWAWHGAGEAITGPFDLSSFLLLLASAIAVGGAAIAQFGRRNLHL